MTTRVRAKFDGRAFIPEEPIDVPVGELFELGIRVVNAAEDGPKHGLLSLIELTDQFEPNPDAVTDAAIQHDHYLYGTPKRS